MDEQPSKRQYRKRKAVGVPNAVEEGADASSNDIGNGETSGNRPEVETVSVGQSQGMDFLSFAKLIASKQTLHNGIRIAYHPSPESELIFTEKGNIIVLSGEMCYQTSDGIKHSV